MRQGWWSGSIYCPVGDAAGPAAEVILQVIRYHQLTTRTFATEVCSTPIPCALQIKSCPRSVYLSDFSYLCYGGGDGKEVIQVESTEKETTKIAHNVAGPRLSGGRAKAYTKTTTNTPKSRVSTERQTVQVGRQNLLASHL